MNPDEVGKRRPLRLCIISGTNRAGSNTRRLAARLQEDYTTRCRQSGRAAQVEVLDLAQLPATLLSPESYARKPIEFAPFSEAVLSADGLVVVAPEYNGGYPGALKLFIDHLPFPDSFDDRPVAFIGLADGHFGGLRPIEQLAQVFAYRNARLFNRRIHIPQVSGRLGADGRIADPLTESLLEAQTAGFIEFCAHYAGMSP
jgi:chromate reductase